MCLSAPFQGLGFNFWGLLGLIASGTWLCMHVVTRRETEYEKKTQGWPVRCAGKRKDKKKKCHERCGNPRSLPHGQMQMLFTPPPPCETTRAATLVIVSSIQARLLLALAHAFVPPSLLQVVHETISPL